MNKHVVKTDETIVLIDSKFRKFLVDTTEDTRKIKGIGVINPKELVGKKIGEKLGIGNKEFWILRPSLTDKLHAIKRKAQIILPKDAAHILMQCGLESGDKVLEAGIGSGSLTIALATAVAPEGKVFSYDIREDFIEHAQRNLKKAELDQFVTIKLKDVTKAIDENELKAVILDIATPWKAVTRAWNALTIGGYLCTYSPLISQVEKTIKEMRKQPFIEIQTIENIQREMIVSERGTRPSFDILGHTGYLTFGRKTLE